MADEETTLAIIGGGAAGLTAAIAAAQYLQKNCPTARVCLYEKDDRIGRSILVTGNGRCNFSNSHIRAQRYYHADFVQEAFQAAYALLPQKDYDDAVHSFFHDAGLVWRQEDDGRQYPLANKASVVLDVLRARLAELPVSIFCEQEVVALSAPNRRSRLFALHMKDGKIEHHQSVIVACGGRHAAPLRMDDLSYVNPKPVLGPLSVVSKDKHFTRELDNIRVRAAVSLWREHIESSAFSNKNDKPGFKQIACEEGELMFRKYGLSGICIFNLSRFAKKGDIIRIDFLRDVQQDAQQDARQDAVTFLSTRYKDLAAQSLRALTYEDMLRGLVLPRIGEALLKKQGHTLQDEFDSDEIERLAQYLTCCEVEIAGIADSDLCQVQRGGLAVGAFDPQTLRARKIAGLYAAGEALDVDGPCGGYNLHWAWTSGLIAGSSAARALCTSDSGDSHDR